METAGNGRYKRSISQGRKGLRKGIGRTAGVTQECPVQERDRGGVADKKSKELGL